MDTSYLLLFLLVIIYISLSAANTYSVKITTEQHINVVDSRFLSFTIDPKYLFSSRDNYNSNECICMASALAPAYLRIAGPSTAYMTFHNTTISLTEPDLEGSSHDLHNSDFERYSRNFDNDFEVTVLDDSPKKVNLNRRELAVSHRQWKRFVQWSKNIGFDLVFALNNEERTAKGMWDPNTALNILTVAERTRVGDIYWELGYECSNQSIEEYLNDLETLRVIVETFPPGRTGQWRVVGGDVTHCLQADSKSDFKDYVILSIEMMDALLLNGNSSSYELERMSENERLKLLRHLSRSQTPLWLTETSQYGYSELERAADWLAGLGFSARNGFSINYRELDETELYEPTLSFYMALLFKNLVGEKVLDLQMDPEQAILFAHCTSLRRKPVPGAVTLFGVNMDDEPARFSLKLAKREDGGDIMHFILSNDNNGNIVVNGRAMISEGDIKPIVKRVRPYKTLLLNLPSKSFGFWVLANTKVDACQHTVDNEDNIIVKTETTNHGTFKRKRSVIDDFDDYANTADVSYDFYDRDSTDILNTALKMRVNSINKNLNSVRQIFENKRNKRQDESENHVGKKKFRKQRLRNRNHNNNESKVNRLINLLKTPQRDMTKSFRRIGEKLRLRKGGHLRNLRNLKVKTENKEKVNKNQVQGATLDLKEPNEKVTRKRRSIKETDESEENDINFDKKTKAKLWKVLKQIQEQLHDITLEKSNYDSKERIFVNTEVSDDIATIKVIETETGLLKSTMENIVDVLEGLNKNLGRFWNAVTLFE